MFTRLQPHTNHFLSVHHLLLPSWVNYLSEQQKAFFQGAFLFHPLTGKPDLLLLFLEWALPSLLSCFDFSHHRLVWRVHHHGHRTQGSCVPHDLCFEYFCNHHWKLRRKASLYLKSHQIAHSISKNLYRIIPIPLRVPNTTAFEKFCLISFTFSFILLLPRLITSFDSLTAVLI